ncbi:MAG TPA: cellulase family glycosylhydrolase [Caulobacteraceae bacterium]|jgi:hypothetical protein
MTPEIRPHGRLMLDAAGRQVTLRGVNLGGDCKVPWPDGGANHPSDFSDHRDVSFIGRPFPLAEADEHLGRIAGWGFNTLRLLTTWEAVEHAGPGLYDQAYLDYLTEVCDRAGQHGLHLFVDFHQDVWSRMSGGDGAPGWTFEAVGLDFTRFDAAGAAHIMQARYDYADPTPRQAAYPQMTWGSNYRLPANTLMWTLFWAGKHLTPQFLIDGANVQDFLQGCYLGAMGEVGRRLKDMPHVLGFDTLNEPHPGWLGQPMTYRHLAASAAHPEAPRVGPALSPLDGLALALGFPVTVPFLTRQRDGRAVATDEPTLNSDRMRVWRDGHDCPFERAGAYRMSGAGPVAQNEDFFRRWGEAALSISDHAYRPFYHRVAETIRAENPDWTVFAEMDAFALHAGRAFPGDLPERTVNASHWYDARALYLKHVGDDPEDETRERYIRELGRLKGAGDAFGETGAPSLVGEFGIPFDLDDGESFTRWAAGERDGVWRAQEMALSLMYDAMDALGLHSTQWNYTASNANDARIGDGWNQEDLSVFSRDQAGGPDDGGRAVAGFCRPWASRVQGRIVGTRFERGSATFRLDVEADAGIAAPTEFYVPRLHYPDGFVVRVEGVPASIEFLDDRQRVTVQATASGPAWILVTAPRPR